MENKKFTRFDFLKKVSGVLLALTGISFFMEEIMPRSIAATNTCGDCDHAIRIIDSKTGYITCYLIAAKNRLELKNPGEFYKASFYRSTSTCPAKTSFNLTGFVKRTDAPFPPVFSGLTPYGGYLGPKVTPGIHHPEGIYSCSSCGYGQFYIYTSSAIAKLLICGKCSFLMKA